MTFQSLKFIIFFLCSVIAVFSVPRKAQNLVLLLCNFLFAILVGGVLTVSFLLVATLSTFFAGIMIQKSKTITSKKIYLALPFILNIGFLFVLKYSAFFTSTANAISMFFHIEHQFEYLKILAPVGISFYTLWMLGYLLDVYWASYEAEKNFINYAAFATYFPLITSGPIVRYQNMREQFSKERVLTADNVSKGILRVCWGFFQKMVIADNVARIVNQVFDNYTQYTGIYIFFGIVCFAAQLYTDFCGCIDIALGCSQILGISLPENFDAPFFSKSIAEYWRRWHITLGTWFKDYFMYPILKSKTFIQLGQRIKSRRGKKAGKKIPVYLAMSILWFTIGFWHGGLWKYIIGSGLLHCIYMIVSDSMDGFFKKIKALLHINDSAWWWKGFQMIRTFLLVCSGFVFFRSTNVSHALNMYNNLCKYSNFSVSGMLSLLTSSNISLMKFTIVCFSVAIVFTVSLVRKTNIHLFRMLYSYKVLLFIIALVLVGMIFLFAATGKTSFIYFQF